MTVENIKGPLKMERRTEMVKSSLIIGIMKYPNGDIYTGSFVDDNRDGYGK